MPGLGARRQSLEDLGGRLLQQLHELDSTPDPGQDRLLFGWSGSFYLTIANFPIAWSSEVWTT